MKRRLGHGGMGSVFLAFDESHRALALKVIDPEVDDARARARFQREICAVSAIRHANVVRLIRAGEADGQPFALFERVRGRAMSRVGPQPWPVVVGLGRQLAGAVVAVHAAGWLHRDLKRSNAMVGDHGLVTLIDFGLARPLGRCGVEPPGRIARCASPELTGPGAIVGTPRYLAPELRRGWPASGATDVYSLGLILFELLGGELADDGSFAPPSVPLPVALRSILAATLAADPRHRPGAATVAAVLDMLPASTAVVRRRGASDDLATWPAGAAQESRGSTVRDLAAPAAAA